MNHEIEQNHRLRNTVIGVSLVATAILHGYIEKETTHGHGPRVEVYNPWAVTTTGTLDAGLEEAGDPYLDTITETETTPGDPVGTKSAEHSFTGAAYARAFDADQRAGELETESISALIDTVETLQRNGWDVELKVQGHASAEDESVDSDGGLQTPSAANQRLADFRSSAFIDQLVVQGIDEDLISQEVGQEDSLSNSQMESLESMRQQYGYDSVYAMIEAYNTTPNDVPIAVAMSLHEWLGEERGVSVVLVATRNQVGPGTSAPVKKEVCYVPVIAIKNEVTSTESWEVTIPYGLIGGLTGIMIASTATLAVAIKQDAARRSVRRGTVSSSAGGTGGGGNGGDGDGDGNQGESESTAPEELTDDGESEPIKSDTPEKRKRRILPWLITPVFIIGSGLALRECLDNDGPSTPPEVAQVDTCEGKEPVNKIVGTRTVKIRDGKIVGTTTDMIDD